MNLFRQRLIGFIACVSTSLALGCIGPNCNVTTGSCSKVSAAPDNNFAKTHFSGRAVGQQYLIYGAAGVQNKINLPCQDCTYGVFDVTVLYEQTVRSHEISSYFASNKGTTTIAAGLNGSMPNDVYRQPDDPTQFITFSYVGNPDVDIRSSDLGLSSSNYEGTFCYRPEIQNVVINLDCWAGFDSLVRGLYTRLRIPINYSRWDLRLTNNGSEDGFNDKFVQGFINHALVPDTLTPTAMPDALTSGALALNGRQTVGDIPPLRYGRVCDVNAQWGVSDMPFDFGYNFLLRDYARVGSSLHIVIPTGTKNDGECIFTPRVGYGRWQVGIQIGGQFTFIDEDTTRATIYSEVMVSAMLGQRESRLLGLKANGNSTFNYELLLKKFTVQNNTVTAVALERAANLLFQPIKLQTNVNSDIAVWIEVQRNCYEFEFGWQFVGRGAEQLQKKKGGCSACSAYRSALLEVPGATFGDDQHIYVIKGDTPEYFITTDMMDAITGEGISGYAYSKVDSDIRTLGTLVVPTAGDPFGVPNVTALTLAGLTNEDVVADAALQPSFVTNALVAFIGYNFIHERFTPFVGVGGFYEFGYRNRSMDMVGFFAKGGFGF